jgi:hypothetical protein
VRLILSSAGTVGLVLSSAGIVGLVLSSVGGDLGTIL